MNMPGARGQHCIDNEHVMNGWVSTGATQRAPKALQGSRPELPCCFHSVPIRTCLSSDVNIQLQPSEGLAAIESQTRRPCEQIQRDWCSATMYLYVRIVLCDKNQHGVAHIHAIASTRAKAVRSMELEVVTKRC